MISQEDERTRSKMNQRFQPWFYPEDEGIFINAHQRLGSVGSPTGLERQEDKSVERIWPF